MQELRSVEVRSTVEDLMYVSILEKFMSLGVDMMPRMEGAYVCVWWGGGGGKEGSIFLMFFEKQNLGK